MSALTDPDLGPIDALARLQLMVRRDGGEVRLDGAGARLRELLSFVGLEDVLPVVREPGRQAE